MVCSYKRWNFSINFKVPMNEKQPNYGHSYYQNHQKNSLVGHEKW